MAAALENTNAAARITTLPSAIGVEDNRNSIDQTTYESCASHQTCDSCLNASYACHFCEFDFQCHAIGSPLGCITGISTCHHLEDCKRPEPQHVGYGPPPSVVIAVLCLVVTLTCCICGVSAICSVFCRSKRQRKAPIIRKKPGKKTGTVTLVSREDQEFVRSQHQPLLADVHEDEILTFHEDMDRIALDRLQAQRESDRQVSWGAFFTRITWFAFILSITVLALMFYPRMPDYNVCNREFEWESILQSLRSLHPKIDYQILMSVINENRFGFIVKSGSADIYHNNTLVGKWELTENWEAEAGAISDVIAPIHIEPTFTEAWSLWNDFRNNQLIFNINATIVGDITWGKHKIYRITQSVRDIEFLVGAEYDRGLCKCTEYLTPQ